MNYVKHSKLDYELPQILEHATALRLQYLHRSKCFWIAGYTKFACLTLKKQPYSMSNTQSAPRISTNVKFASLKGAKQTSSHTQTKRGACESSIPTSLGAGVFVDTQGGVPGTVFRLPVSLQIAPSESSDVQGHTHTLKPKQTIDNTLPGKTRLYEMARRVVSQRGPCSCGAGAILVNHRRHDQQL